MSPSYTWGKWNSELARGCPVSVLWLAPAYLAGLSSAPSLPSLLS